MTNNTQSRKWQITINNPLDKGYTHDKIIDIVSHFKSVIYWCMSDEIGENGTYHTHIFLCSKSGIRFSMVKKNFDGGHFEMCKGTAAENKDYVSKSGKWEKDRKKETCVSGTFYESGELPVEQKGHKVSFEDVYDLLGSGLSTMEIVEEYPSLLLQMDKIEFARQAFLREKYKTVRRELEVVYIYGASRTGKTRSVMDKFGYDKVYRVTDYKHPFDNYNGQDVIVFEEFRSSLSLSEMLNYLDNYPVELRCRYSNKQALYTKVFVISNIALTDQYSGCDSRDLDAFYHRFNLVRHFTNSGFNDYVIEFLGTGFRFVESCEAIPFSSSVKG